MASSGPTIVDIARETGLSVSSVSVALRGEAGVSARSRELVLETAERLGYRPDRRARGLRERRSRLVGVTFWLGQSFHSELVEALYEALAGSGYELVLSATTPQRGVADAVESLRRERCDVVLLVSPDVAPDELARIAARQPTIVLGSDIGAPEVDEVRADDEAGMRLVVDRLVGLGHRRVCFVDGGGAAMARTRRAGFVAAAEGAGLRVDVVPGYPTEEAGARAARALLDRGVLPTAVVAHNDMVALGVLLTLREAAVRVPEDVSVVGYDDSRMAALSTIDLTTVSQEPQQLAAIAARRAVARAEGARAGEPAVVLPRLVERSTAGLARDGGRRTISARAR